LEFLKKKPPEIYGTIFEKQGALIEVQKKPKGQI